ncbi:MAG: hypothetical protein GYB67_18725, partial [Chloroflexi bacterium]|nr:hypothetical protein [Chloroflexota bacterium]
PGIADPGAVLDDAIAPGRLEFADFGGLTFAQVEALTGQQIVTTGMIDAQPASDPPPDAFRRPDTDEPFATILDGSQVMAATAVEDDFNGGWRIEVRFSPEAGETLAAFTRANIGMALAIVLNGEVLSAPTIQSEVGTEVVITGTFTADEARALAAQLRGGMLPLPLIFESITIIGAPATDAAAGG